MDIAEERINPICKKTTMIFESTIPSCIDEYSGAIVIFGLDINLKITFDTGKEKSEIKKHLISILNEVLEYFDNESKAG